MSVSTSSTDRPTAKRQLSSKENGNVNNKSNIFDIQSTTPDDETKSPSKSSIAKVFDSDSEESFDTLNQNDKRRPPCLYGASYYRKNPAHRTEQSHLGDSGYEDKKQTNDDQKKDDCNADCPYGKACYRTNPQHKRDYKH